MASKASEKKLCILVVDDDVVNQLVTTAILEDMGHTVSIVEDGREAIVALEHDSFDLVLMDLQMPNMDGHEATRVLREHGRRIPIIAATAHAPKDEEARCLSVGMNGFLSKPIDKLELARLIEQLSPLTSPAETVLDQAALFERLGERPELLGQLLELFPAECQKRISEIREAVALNQASEIERAAHRLVGMASSLSAMRTAGAARVLEDLAHQNKLHIIPEALATFENELSLLLPTLATLVTRMTPP